MESNSKLALIICTRNRSDQILGFLTHLLEVEKLPQCIVVVDSSDGRETEVIVESFRSFNFPQIVFLKSEPGLPHQRNIAISYIKAAGIKNLRCITFLDDDCRIERDYFIILNDYVSNNNFIGITGSPKGERKHTKFIYRLLQIDSKISGCVLKSGIGVAPSASLSEWSEWMPGLCMNINPEVFLTYLFKNEWRMYYEDIEFSLQVSPPNGFICLRGLHYSHLEEQQGRENPRLVSLYSDGARWQLSKDYPKVIKKWAVITSIIGLIFSDLVGAFNPSQRTYRLESIIGHLLFWKRLVLNQTTLQFRTTSI